MKTINISVSDNDAEKFRLNAEEYSFSELMGILRCEMAKQTLDESIALAEKYGLSKMTMEEISNEVKAVRRYAKDHS